MQRALPLLRRQITLSDALADDDNVLQELSYPEQRFEFYLYLYQQRTVIESIVSYHLNLNKNQTCRVGEVKDWIAGSFNVCIPVHIDGHSDKAPKRVLIRFPLPYKFTEIEQTPFFERLKWYFHRLVSSVFRHPLRPPYSRRNCPFNLTTGYHIMDHIGGADSVMLSESWDKLRHDQRRRTNLFRGMSQIMLSLAQSPSDRIGSLTINNEGIIEHTNRPLTLRLHHLENESVPTSMDRDLTYSTSDSYFMDLLSYQDSRLRHAPNSIRDTADGEAQLATPTVMRALLPQFSCRNYRRGPFIMTLTDLHQSNIFVDSAWNIKSLVDLEWTCSLPVEMLHPPYWLTSRGVDMLFQGEHLDALSTVHAEFINFWYFHALASPKGLYNIFLEHIQTRFLKLDDTGMVEFERTISPYRTPGMKKFLEGKLQDKENYEARLRDLFAAAQEEPPSSGSPAS
ncbi:hypothetical protein BJY04DRAFT_231781 [Aspergillus karnatakaensis]|uniref:uncharacterized protein n=1 Tax=Aspergillus karnatakaensis TaxID=1810916 RepID=UPI003CCD0965